MDEAAGAIAIDTKLVAATFTLRVAVAVTVPEVAVIVTDPEEEAFAKPAALIDATVASVELHCTALVTSFKNPLESWAVALNCWVAPVPIDIEDGEMCNEEMDGWDCGDGGGGGV